MANTPDWGLPIPEGTTDVTPLQTPFAVLASAVDGALTTLQSQLAHLPVNSTAERDAIFPNPVQGDSVFRKDRGWGETYFGAYSPSTNPGGVTAGAGWYPVYGNFPMLSLQSNADNTSVPQQGVPAGTGVVVRQGWGTAAPAPSRFITYSGNGPDDGGRFIIQIAGRYQVDFVIGYTNNATDGAASILINGQPRITFEGGSTVGGTHTWVLGAGTVIELQGYNPINSGFNTRTRISLSYEGPA